MLCCTGIGLSVVESAAAITCARVRRTCVDSADRRINGQIVHRDCWRYEIVQRCVRTVDPTQKTQCEVPTIQNACRTLSMTCSKEDDRFGCMEKAYQLHCQKPITGPGITLGKMSTEIDWLDPAARIDTLCHTKRCLRKSRRKELAD